MLQIIIDFCIAAEGETGKTFLFLMLNQLNWYQVQYLDVCNIQ